MTDPAKEDGESPSVRGIATLVAANSSLLVAGLVYMGWEYLNALWGYFHLNPLSFGVGIVEYLLRSLTLFSPVVVLFAVLFVAVTSARAWDFDWAMLWAHASKYLMQLLKIDSWPKTPRAIRRMRDPQRLMAWTGVFVTVAGLALAGVAERASVSTYLVLALICSGPLLLTAPKRAHRYGRMPYALAVVIAAICVLWAGSLYASSKGTRDARNFVRSLPSATAVTVYSAQHLELAGPEVKEHDLGSGVYYRYEYYGLRLLTARSGTYYLVPLGWTQRQGLTYVISASDQIRINLYSAVIKTS